MMVFKVYSTADCLHFCPVQGISMTTYSRLMRATDPWRSKLGAVSLLHQCEEASSEVSDVGKMKSHICTRDFDGFLCIF